MKNFKMHLPIILILIGVFFCCALSGFSFFGQDGYYLWRPIISEYLKGANAYSSSEVIFNGQNLLAICGELPLWKVFRAFNLSIDTFLNLTFFVWFSLMLLSIYAYSIGVDRKLKSSTSIAISLILIVSPVVSNRLLAGHFNLLFGVLPFFTYMALLYSRGLKMFVFAVISIWFALSMQSYQILTYSVFYAPILVLLALKDNKVEIKGFIIFSLSTSLIAFLLNYPVFSEMLAYAQSKTNLRSLGSNAVYSYTVSSLKDLPNLLFSDMNSLTLTRPIGFFHEMNYGMGAFLFLFFIGRRIEIFLKITVFVSLLFFWGFASNWLIFNLISELPLVQAFRVPQRIYMILALFIPIYVVIKEFGEFDHKMLSLTLALIFILTFVPYSSMAVIPLALVIFLLGTSDYISQKYMPYALSLSLVSIAMGIDSKLELIRKDRAKYVFVKDEMKAVYERLKEEKALGSLVQFESENVFIVDAVAKEYGIRTIQGYGHPPLNHINRVKDVVDVKFDPMMNSFFISPRISKYKSILKHYGVKIIVRFKEEGFEVEKL